MVSAFYQLCPHHKETLVQVNLFSLHHALVFICSGFDKLFSQISAFVVFTALINNI